MNHNKNLLPVLFVALLFLVSCYPGKKVIARWPDGKPRVVRYFKRNDSANEKLVAYYQNGKKQSVRYYKTEKLEDYKWKEWYESGAKKWVRKTDYKDTATVFSSKDSGYVFTYLYKAKAKQWYQDGKLWYTQYSKNGQEYNTYYHDTTGVCWKADVKSIRPDGYTAGERVKR